MMNHRRWTTYDGRQQRRRGGTHGNRSYDEEAHMAIRRAVHHLEVRSAISRAVCYDEANMISMATMLIMLIVLSSLQYACRAQNL